METHGLKHHYLHHQQQQNSSSHHPHHHHQSQHSSHNSHSIRNSAQQPFGTVSIQGSSAPTPTTTKISSTAFPLLLSSIESGRQGLNGSAFSRTKSSNSNGAHNASGLSNSSGQAYGSTPNCYKTLSHLGASLNKHKPESKTSHINGGVKGTPKLKTAATPNSLTNSGRHQATLGHNANNHHHTQTKSLSHLTEANPLSPLPFKKNLNSRDTVHNNGTNGFKNKFKDGKNSVSSTGAKRSSIRSPTPRSSLSSASKQATCNQNNHFDHQPLSGVVCSSGAGAVAKSSQLHSKDLDKSSPSQSVTNNLHSQTTSAFTSSQSDLAKPTEFKFFKEKAKDKLKKSSVDSDQSGKSVKQQQSATSPLSSSKANFKSSNADSVAAKKSPAKGSRKKSDRCSSGTSSPAVGHSQESSRNSAGQCPVTAPSSTEHLPGALSAKDSTTPDAAVTVDDDHPTSQVPNHQQQQQQQGTDQGDKPTRTITYTEFIIDNFALQVFTTRQDLICALDESDRARALALSPDPSLPPDAEVVRPPSPLERVIFCRRSPPPPPESDEESDSGTIQSSLSLQSPLSSPTPHRSKTSKVGKKVSPKVKGSKSPKVKDQMVKEPAKLKKPKGKQVSEDSNLPEDDDEDESMDEEEEVVVSKNTRKAKKAVLKCTHKHPKKQSACARCLLAHKKKQQAAGKKSAGSKLRKKGPVGRKAKCKPVNSRSRASKRGSASKGKVSKRSQRSSDVHSENDDNDSSDEHEDDDESDEDMEEDDESQNSESDATQDEEDDESEDSDDSSESGADDTIEDNRTIADLIKCSNRREAVRKAAARAAMASVGSRNKINRSTPIDLGPTTSNSSSGGFSSSGPPTTVSNASATSTVAASNSTTTTTTTSAAAANVVEDDSAGKKKKLKRIQSQAGSGGKSSKSIGKTKAKKPSSTNHHKRNQSDSSDNEQENDEQNDDDQWSEMGDDNEETTSDNVIMSPKRGATGGRAKKVLKTNKNSKKSKEVIDDSHDEMENNDDAEDDGSDQGADEQVVRKSGKNNKRNLRSKANKSNNKKDKVVKQAGVTSKSRKKKIVESEVDEERKENDDSTEEMEDDADDQNLTEDAEMDDADEGGEEVSHDSSDGEQEDEEEKDINSTSKKSKNVVTKTKKTNKKPVSSVRNRKQKSTTKAAKSKQLKSKRTDKKSAKAKQDAKKCSIQSENDTEESEAEQEEEEACSEANQSSDQQAPPPPPQPPKSKCDKSKAKHAKDSAEKVTAPEKCGGQVKDIYTFELSPAEVPCSNARLVLPSTQDSKTRFDCGGKIDTSQSSSIVCSTVGTDTPVTSTSPTTTTSTSNLLPVKSSFSPKSHSSGQEYSNGLAFEPLRPDTYTHYESSFGPNASLSSLSQLSQSIGGAGPGPILLNHQNNGNNKCQINIKEEPKDDQTSVRSLSNPKAAPIHRTPPPSVAGDHLSASQNYGANFVCSKNGHPRRLWSNASAGSLISSSSSSSSSPVHPAFGHCPPTPATPASLASYFSPSTSLPGITPSVYSSQNQELLRRELDSRLLASSAHDRNLLSSTLAIPPPAGPLTPIHTPTHFNHTASSSPLIPPASSSSSFTNSLASSASYLPHNSAPPLYPISPSLTSPAYLNSPIRTVTPFNVRPTPSQHPVSVVTPSSSSRPPSSSSFLAPTPSSQTSIVKKGTWPSMHVRIAWDIYQKQKSKQKTNESKPSTNTSRSNTPSKSSKSSKHNTSSSSRTNEQSSNSNNQQSSNSAKPACSSASKNSYDSVNGASNAIRSSSATTFASNYPPRYGTPYGTPSLSAPPMLPGLFPPNIQSPMQIPGLLSDVWPRHPIPGSLPAPIPSNRGQYLFNDYNASANSASSALSAWAASIRPPADSLPGSSHSKSSDQKPSSSGSQKRKLEDSQHSNKERPSSSSKHANISSSVPYQNGDIRSDHPNKKPHRSSSSKQPKNESGQSSRTTIYENGDRNKSRNEAKTEFSSKKSTVESKHESRFSHHSNPSSESPSLAQPPIFGSSFGPNEQQRYYDLLGAMPTMNPSFPSSNPYMTPRNSADLASRPLWHFGLPPPPPLPTSSSSVIPSPAGPPNMMPDPFKSLQDISLRPGLVTPDRETLFSRYSMLNSSGGGASIFDKLNKEHLDKIEMMQNQNKMSQAVAGNSSKPPLNDLSSSRSSSGRLPPLPPTSMPAAVPPTASTPFPYPPPYLNSLHHLAPPGAPYLSPQMGSASFANSATNSILNGADSISKMTLAHHPGIPLPPGFPTDYPASSSQFLLPPHYPPAPGAAPPGMVNYLKTNPTHANFNSAR